MQKTAAKPEQKSLNVPEETRNLENGKVEVVKISDVPIGRATFLPGWKGRPASSPTRGEPSGTRGFRAVRVELAVRQDHVGVL